MPAAPRRASRAWSRRAPRTAPTATLAWELVHALVVAGSDNARRRRYTFCQRSWSTYAADAIPSGVPAPPTSYLLEYLGCRHCRCWDALTADTADAAILAEPG